PWRGTETVLTPPARRERSNAGRRGRLFLRPAGDPRLVGPRPGQRKVSLAAFGALTDSKVRGARSVVNPPRIRTVGNGRMILRVAVSCRTWPVVGTGVGTGVATSKTGGGVGTGVGTGVGVGVGVGVGGATVTGPLAAEGRSSCPSGIN